MIRLLFLWDAEAYGGHDVTALVALRRLALEPALRIGVLHTGRSQRLTRELESLYRLFSGLEMIRVEATATLSESLDGIFRGPRTRSIQKVIRRWKPDLAVNVQGFITLGLCGLAACRALGVPVVSYIPMTHRIWDLYRSPVAWFQDKVNLYWYNVPAAFITISNRMLDKLVQEHRVSRDSITVVECGPDRSMLKAYDREIAREQLGYKDEYIVALIGRLEFSQKCQDFFIRTVANFRDLFNGYHFLIVGDGPDLQAAIDLVTELEVGGLINFMAWQDDMTEIYHALDVVLIPSRYEGVPLVMLEAMACRVPVLAAAVDGMVDVLPSENLFEYGNAVEMVEKLCGLRNKDNQETVDQLAHVIETRLNATVFADQFTQEILRIAGK